MASKILFGVVALCLTNTLADSQSVDTTVSDYIYWKKADIMQWHQYFPSWVLEEERQTNLAAVAAVSSLASSLNSSLSKIVEFQAQELLTAQLMVAGTDAEGCVNGISEYMTKAINEEVSTYNDCAADALSNLKRVNKTLSGLKTKYTTAYQKALVRIDVCAKTYPNKDSLDRLKSCVEAMNKMYFTVANATQKALFPSPSMAYFQSVIVGCASDAATAVATKGAQFLQELLDCSVLDSNIDRAAYAEELSQWQGYNGTLATQIATAQNKNYDQVWAVKNQTITYYNLQKDVLEKYVIESRGLSFYLNKMYSYLSDYYNTITATSVDNPGDAACLTSATSSLQLVVNTAASQSLSCDHDIVNNTRQMMDQVSSDFLRLNTLIPAIGNAAILNCIVKGYVYAPDTIDNCFNLVSLEFDIEYTDRNADITRNVDILNAYINSFFSSSDLPCGGTTLKAAYLAAEVALYNLQRCLYITSGTVYSVTTPQPITTPGQITTSQPNATSYW